MSGQAGRAGQHQRPAAEPVDGADGDEGEDQVDRAGDDDVEQDVGDVVAGGREDLLGVVEDDVDAAPLLKDGQDDAEEQDLGQAGLEQVAEVDLAGLARRRASLGCRPGPRRRRPGPPTLARIRPASSARPFLASQRGLSGTKNMQQEEEQRRARPSAPNIQRQPVWPFQEARISAAVAPGGTGRAMSQLTTWAARMPMTMVSWLIETSRPRMAAGAISAMYMGERFEARPMATPPRMRQATKTVKLGASAVPTRR